MMGQIHERVVRKRVDRVNKKKAKEEIRIVQSGDEQICHDRP